MPYNQTFMVDSPNNALQSHKVSAQNSPRGGVGGQNSLKNPENPEKLSPAGEGRYWGGRPLWDMSTYLHQHRRGITQTFMVDSPGDNIQTHKVSGPNSQRGRVGGQKSLENPENVMKACLSEAPRRALARTGTKRGRITIEPQNHRARGP